MNISAPQSGSSGGRKDLRRGMALSALSIIAFTAIGALASQSDVSTVSDTLLKKGAPASAEFIAKATDPYGTTMAGSYMGTSFRLAGADAYFSQNGMTAEAPAGYDAVMAGVKQSISRFAEANTALTGMLTEASLESGSFADDPYLVSYAFGYSEAESGHITPETVALAGADQNALMNNLQRSSAAMAEYMTQMQLDEPAVLQMAYDANVKVSIKMGGRVGGLSQDLSDGYEKAQHTAKVDTLFGGIEDRISATFDNINPLAAGDLMSIKARQVKIDGAFNLQASPEL